MVVVGGGVESKFSVQLRPKLYNFLQIQTQSGPPPSVTGLGAVPCSLGVGQNLAWCLLSWGAISSILVQIP